jgi:hypothetical protein
MEGGSALGSKKWSNESIHYICDFNEVSAKRLNSRTGGARLIRMRKQARPKGRGPFRVLDHKPPTQ